MATIGRKQRPTAAFARMPFDGWLIGHSRLEEAINVLCLLWKARSRVIRIYYKPINNCILLVRRLGRSQPGDGHFMANCNRNRKAAPPPRSQWNCHPPSLFCAISTVALSIPSAHQVFMGREYLPRRAKRALTPWMYFFELHLAARLLGCHNWQLVGEGVRDCYRRR